MFGKKRKAKTFWHNQVISYFDVFIKKKKLIINNFNQILINLKDKKMILCRKIKTKLMYHVYFRFISPKQN